MTVCHALHWNFTSETLLITKSATCWRQDWSISAVHTKIKHSVRESNPVLINTATKLATKYRTYELAEWHLWQPCLRDFWTFICWKTNLELRAVRVVLVGLLSWRIFGGSHLLVLSRSVILGFWKRFYPDS